MNLKSRCNILGASFLGIALYTGHQYNNYLRYKLEWYADLNYDGIVSVDERKEVYNELKIPNNEDLRSLSNAQIRRYLKMQESKTVTTRIQLK